MHSKQLKEGQILLINELLPLLYAGYDVFIVDHRLSMELPHAIPSSLLPTMDVVANLDWPAAVWKVLEISGAEQIDVVAHCMGSTTFLMSMLAGNLDGKIRYEAVFYQYYINTIDMSDQNWIQL